VNKVEEGMNTGNRGSGFVEKDLAAGNPSQAAGWGTDRRSFLQRVGAGATGAVAAGLAWPGVARGDGPRSGRVESAEQAQDSSGDQRSRDAEQIRVDAARLSTRRPQPGHPNNGEEELYGNRIASYSKALPHNQLGEVDLKAYKALLWHPAALRISRAFRWGSAGG
jgi:hypothetical protein